MIPVDQIHLAPPLGDCFRACVASILEMSSDEVPNFVGEYEELWWQKFIEWLKPLNLTAYDIPAETQDGYEVVTSGYVILTADSPRFQGGLHCVVTLDNVIVHDPHPDRANPTGKRRYWTILSPLDPAKPFTAG